MKSIHEVASSLYKISWHAFAEIGLSSRFCFCRAYVTKLGLICEKSISLSHHTYIFITVDDKFYALFLQIESSWLLAALAGLSGAH